MPASTSIKTNVTTIAKIKVTIGESSPKSWLKFCVVLATKLLGS